MSVSGHEQAKYADIWTLSDYADHSPGLTLLPMFEEIAKPKKGQTLIDLGCGQGVAGKMLAAQHGLRVAYLDLVKLVDDEHFLEQPLWKPLPPLNWWGSQYDYGYCCDVMEHIPEAFTMLSVRNMLRACRHVFFSISFLPDHFGKYAGEPLHLTVKPYTWWRDNLREMGDLIEARDMIGEGVFYVSADQGKL